jgi:hypothetical protein
MVSGSFFHAFGISFDIIFASFSDHFCVKNIPGMRTGGKWSLCRTITSITTMRQGYMEWWIP